MKIVHSIYSWFTETVLVKQYFLHVKQLCVNQFSLYRRRDSVKWPCLVFIAVQLISEKGLLDPHYPPPYAPAISALKGRPYNRWDTTEPIIQTNSSSMVNMFT